MEARIARLESDVAHLRSDVSEIKTSLQEKFGTLKDHVSSTTVWALLLYIALAGGTFSTMARAFGWI
jgi:hypothetical protein